MKKTRIIILLLTITLVFLLIGCGQATMNNTGTANTASNQQENLFASQEKTPRHEDGRSIVTLSIYYLTAEVQQAVTAFNQSNEEYYVEILTNDDDMDAATFWEREMVELSLGKGPDIFIKTLQTNFNDYIQKGVMEDLAPYIERDLNKEDFLESSLYAYAKDGKVYAIEPGFTLSLLVGSKEIFGDREGWTYTEMKELADAHPEFTIFENSSVGTGTFLNNYLVYGNPSYTDYDTLRKCIEFDKAHSQRLPDDVLAIPGQNVLSSA